MKNSELSEPLLSVREVAALLGVLEATVRTWISKGWIEAYKIGRDWRLSQAGVRKFLKTRKNRRPGSQRLKR